MRYPNLRYGNPETLRFYAQHVPIKELARRLKRSERSVNDWLAGKRKMPWWIPELLRLQHMETQQQLYRMGITTIRKQLGIVSSGVTQFPATKQSVVNNCHPSSVDAANKSLRHG